MRTCRAGALWYYIAILLPVASWSQFDQALTSGGYWLDGVRHPSGGYRWILTDPTLYYNVQGVTARGMLKAHELTGTLAFYNSAVLSGNYLLFSRYGTDPNLKWSDGSPRFVTADTLFFEELSAATGNPPYSNFVQTWFWNELTGGMYGVPPMNASDYGQAVINLHSGQGIVELVPWDLAFVVEAAHRAGETAIRNALMSKVLQALEATTPADTDYDLIGLLGAIRASTVSGVDLNPANGRYAAQNSTADLLAFALPYQRLSDGAFLYNTTADPNDPSSGDTQVTAYAIMALDAFLDSSLSSSLSWAQRAEYQYRLLLAANFLLSLQQPSGQVLVWPGADPVNDGYLEPHSEALVAFRLAAFHDLLSGIPVDLAGGYCAPSTNPSDPLGDPGVAVASTYMSFPQRVFEYSGGAGAQDATFTPFSDAKKPPRGLTVALPTPGSGESWGFQADIDLSDLGSWVIFPDEIFAVGIHGSTLWGAGVVCYRDGDSFVLQLAVVDLITSTFIAGGFYDADPTQSRFRIRARLDDAGNISATVTPLNGINAGTGYALGSLAHGLTGTVGFLAGFLSYEERACAKARVEQFGTDAISNALYLFADDPYAQPGESIFYRLGMTELTQGVYGYQAFLSAFGPQTFNSGVYTGLPFGTPILPITASLDLAAGVGFGLPPVEANGQLAGLVFDASAAGVAWLEIDADNGNPLFPTQFSDAFANPVIPFRQASNYVVIDGTAPSVSIAAINNGQDVCLGAPAKQGLLTILVTAYDDAPGVIGSGLKCRPTVQIIKSDSTVVNLNTCSWTDNQFITEYTILPSDPCGVWMIKATAFDEAGNQTVASCAFTVNIAQITLNLQLTGVQLASGTITRGIRFTVGGTGGAYPALDFCRNVTFSDPDGLGGAPAQATVIIDASDGLQCGIPTCVSAKDELHTLRKQEPLTNLGNSQFTATLALQGGDANNDNLIDIVDFGLLASQFGQTVGANTACGTPPPAHTDFSGDGAVTTTDYTFIQTGFLNFGDAACTGNYLLSGGRPREKATIKELALVGVPYEIARSFDLDSDGWVTVQEIARWLNGERPNTRK